MIRSLCLLALHILIMMSAARSADATLAHDFHNQEVTETGSWYERIISTHPGQDWSRLRREFADWSRHAERCRAEIRKRYPPLSCYRLIQNELNGRILSSDEYQEATKSLHRICANSAESWGDIEHIRMWLKIPDVPEECRNMLRQRLDRLLYRWRRDDPQRAFNERGRF